MRNGQSEAGFTLAEMLVAIVGAMLVLGGGVAIWTATLRADPGLTSRDTQISAGRTTLERFTRELRQASTTQGASATGFTMVTWVRQASCTSASAGGPVQCQVTYSCASGTCTRRVANADGTSPSAPTQIVAGLRDNNVFAYSPSSAAPTFVTMTLTFPGQSAGSESVTLTDGSAMRNASVG